MIFAFVEIRSASCRSCTINIRLEHIYVKISIDSAVGEPLALFVFRTGWK